MKPNFPEALLLLIISFYATHLKDLKTILHINKKMGRIYMLHFVEVMKIMFTMEQIQNYPELLQYQQEHGCGIPFHARIFHPLNPYENVKVVLEQAVLNKKMSVFKRFIKKFSSFGGSLIENIKAIDPNIPSTAETDLEGFVVGLLYKSYMDRINDKYISEFIEYVFDFKELAKETIQDHFIDANYSFFVYIFNETFCYENFPFLILNDADLALYCKSNMTWSEMFSSWKSFSIWRLKYILPYRPDSYYFLLNFSLNYPEKRGELKPLLRRGHVKQILRSTNAIMFWIYTISFGLLSFVFEDIKVRRWIIVFRLFSPYFIDIIINCFFELYQIIKRNRIMTWNVL